MKKLLVANGELRNIPMYWAYDDTAQNIYLISDERPNYPHADYKHFRACTFACFEDVEAYSEVKLTPALLEALAGCESQALKMMERYEFYRSLFSYDARINLYHKQLQYWYNYLVSNQIECVVFSVVPHVVYDYILYCLCKFLKIKTILLYRITVVVGKNVSVYAFEDLHLQAPDIQDQYEFNLKNPDAHALSDRINSYYEFREGVAGKTFNGVSKKRWSRYFNPSAYVDSIKYRLGYWKEWRQYSSCPDILARGIAAIVRSKRVEFRSTSAPDLDCQYVYVALHFQPECSTSPMGGYFVYQDLMINLLMSTIPKNWKIYIKGHLRAGLSPTLAHRLAFDDRTTLVNEKFPSIKLIKRATVVATVTGTAGFEAVMNLVPVLMFGSYFYQHAPGVFKISSHNDVIQAILAISNNSAGLTEESLLAFLKALDQRTIVGWVDNRYQSMCKISPQENCKNIANLIQSTLTGYHS
jgi:hypothetical protein